MIGDWQVCDERVELISTFSGKMQMKTKTLVMLLAACVAIISLSATSDARRNNANDVGDNRATRPGDSEKSPKVKKPA